MKPKLFLLALVGFALSTGQVTQASAPLSPQGAQAYLEKINEIQSQYGTSSSNKDGLGARGLAQSRLLDVDGDGDLELQVFYVTEKAEEMYDDFQGVWELWEYENALNPLVVAQVGSQLYPGGMTNHALYQVGNQWVYYQEVSDGSPGRLTLSFTVYQIQSQGLVKTGTYEEGTYDWEYNGNYEYVATYNGKDLSSQVSSGSNLVERFKNEYLSDIYIEIFSADATVSYPVESCVSDLEHWASQTPEPEATPEVTPDAPSPAPEQETVPPGKQHATQTQGAAQQYLEILQRYTLQYGTSNGSSQGLASAHLLDLEGDGIQELVLTLCVQGSPTVLRLEVWDIIGSQAVCTYSHSQGQQMATSEDWRDVASLYPYQGGYVLYFAGGGGSDFYQSYDRVFQYEGSGFRLIEEDVLEKNTYGTTVSYTGLVNGEYESGSGNSVASAIPQWYSHFKRIQSTYLSGTPVELFYFDKTKTTWPVDSALAILAQKAEEVAQSSQAPVVIPTEQADPKMVLAGKFKEVLDNTMNTYGLSNGNSNGLAHSMLADFSGDGQVELFLSYITEWTGFQSDEKSCKMTSEVWQLQGDSPVRVYQEVYYLGSNADHGVNLTLVKKDNRWYLYNQSFYGDGGSSEISALENGGFELIFSEGGDTASTYVNGVTVTYEEGQRAREAMEREYQVAEGVVISHIKPEWGSFSALPTLEKILATPQASDHFFGYPVITNQNFRETVASALSLGGEILALYQVEEGLVYAILSVEGKQEGRLLSLSPEGTPELLEEASENFSFTQLEEGKTAYLTALNQEAQEASEKDSEEDSEKDSSRERESGEEGAGLLAYMAGGLACSLTLGGMGWVIYQKSRKPKG